MIIFVINKTVRFQHFTWEIVHMAPLQADKGYNDKSSGMHVKTHIVS